MGIGFIIVVAILAAVLGMFSKQVVDSAETKETAADESDSDSSAHAPLEAI